MAHVYGEGYGLQLINKSKGPKFSGHSQDWADFVRKWEDYLQLVRDVVPHQMGDPLMLRTLQECLDEGSNGQVQLIKETQGRPSFKQVWEYLCGVHGYDPTFQCRKAWEGVTLKVAGADLTKKEFMLFHSQYFP